MAPPRGITLRAQSSGGKFCAIKELQCRNKGFLRNFEAPLLDFLVR